MPASVPWTPGEFRPDAPASAERLSEKSAYQTVAEIRTADGAGVSFAGLKPTGLDLSLPDGLTLHYDLEGRLQRAATPNVQWRRGLSHRTLRLRKRARREGGGLETRVLDRPSSDRVVEETSGRVRAVYEAFQASGRLLRFKGDEAEAAERLSALLSRAAAFDAPQAHADWERFRQLYGEIPILPPDQYGALVLLATEGCVYNQCTFCGFYRGVRYRMKTAEEFARHVHDAIAYHGTALAARRGIFLGQANALTGPRPWRESVLRTVNETFQFAQSDARATPAWWAGSPLRMAGIASFIDAFSGCRITAEEFACLRALNLQRIYFGLETGDARLLSWLKKPADPQQMIAAVSAAKQAGLQVGVIFLVGVGGEEYFDSHVAETVRLVHAMPLESGDYIYLSPLVDMAGTEYAGQSANAGLTPLSAERMVEQERRLRTAFVALPRLARPFVARYDVSQFVY